MLRESTSLMHRSVKITPKKDKETKSMIIPEKTRSFFQ
jgi:hypothetical protein